jgi:hypothetical protein
MVGGQPKQKVHESPISNNSLVWWCAHITPAMQETEIERLVVSGQLGQEKLHEPPISMAKSWA